MHRKYGLVVALVIAGGVGIGAKEKRLPDGPPPSVPLVGKADPAVAQLIADLGSEDYRTREKAGRDLAALGEKALPAMRSALLSTDSPEVQRRLSVLVRKMDTERLVSPKTVTMDLKGKTAKEALEELKKQTGYKIDFSGNSDAREDFKFDKTPFWVAIDKIAAAAGCVVYADYDDENIRVYNQESVNPYVAYAGPFRFMATNLHSSKSVQLSGLNPRQGGNTRSEYMNLNFQIQSEPKNPMLGVTQAEVISAVDDLGGSLVVPPDRNNRSSYYENRGMRGHNTYGNLNLNRGGSKDATVIKSLKARMGIILLTGTTPEITVADPLKVKTKTYIGRTVELSFAGLTEDPNNKGNYNLEVTVKKLGGGEDPNRVDYNWSNNIWNKFELLDADGNRYQTYGPNNFNNNGNAVGLTIPYHTNDRRTGQKLKLGAPVKLVVNQWHSVTHEVTFEFKNIPLP